jgi:hypothetical protein
MHPTKSFSRIFKLILFYLVSSVFISCKKDTVSPTVDDGKGNPTSYVLEQLTYEAQDGKDGSNFYFQYNSNNQVSEIKRVRWGYITTNNDPPVRQENTVTYNFEYLDQLAVKCTQREWFAFWNFEYNYVGDQVARKIIRYANGNIQDSTLYKYDNEGKLTEAVIYTDKANYRSEFTYDNNLITRTNYILNTNPQQKYQISFSGFDNKINFIRTINGLPTTFGGEEFSFFYYATNAPGNYVQARHYNFTGLNENFNAFRTTKHTYQYNEEGLPTRMNADDYTTIFKYRKYK